MRLLRLTLYFITLRTLILKLVKSFRVTASVSLMALRLVVLVMRESFRTMFEPRERIITESGKPEKDEFIGRFDRNGRLELVPNGKTNVYEFIQSFADSVDINVLLAKYKNGDTEALSRVQGMYADISDLPKTFADMLNKVKAGEDAFASLPAETRALFNNSVSEWFASVGNAEWCEKMGMEVPEPPKKKKKISKSDEAIIDDLNDMTERIKNMEVKPE